MLIADVFLKHSDVRVWRIIPCYFSLNYAFNRTMVISLILSKVFRFVYLRRTVLHLHHLGSSLEKRRSVCPLCHSIYFQTIHYEFDEELMSQETNVVWVGALPFDNANPVFETKPSSEIFLTHLGCDVLIKTREYGWKHILRYIFGWWLKNNRLSHRSRRIGDTGFENKMIISSQNIETYAKTLSAVNKYMACDQPCPWNSSCKILSL